ncbi:MAG TPA: right-handed parallel beta-helix repeat-containing protein [Planctomycetota bacterium]
MHAILLLALAQHGLQEAIDALGGKGGVVAVPPGRHVLKASIRVPSGVTLRGSGAGSLLVKCDGAATPLTKAAKAGDASVVVKDVAGFEPGMEIALARLNDGYAPTDMDAWGFDWQHPKIKAIRGTTLELDQALDDSFPAESTTVLNFFPAIRVERAKDVLLDALHIDGNLAKQPAPYSEFQAAAVAILLSTNVRVRDCVVREWPCDGISAQGGSDVIVSGCTVERARGHGFHPGSGITQARFLNNRASGNLFDGLYFCQAVTRSVVDGNLLTGNGRHGIGGLGGGKDAKTRDADNVVSRNVCEANGQAGIEIQVSKGHRVLDNICRGNSASKPGGWAGISIRKASELRIAGNVCSGETQSHGILEEGGESNVITDNQVEGNRGEGLKRVP